jgi:D-glycero-alpha-D-manno-heptose-7-phosphate kinase
VIITRTPLRVSFFGGGTDFPEFFKEEGGAVVSAAINRYSYQIVSEFPSSLFDYAIRISYSRGELVKSVEEIQHPVFRACLKQCGLVRDVEIHVATDLPAFTGLGSSSSFTVGLLHALHSFKGDRVLHSHLAQEAVYIEREVLKECVGLQDQYAAAYGGFNLIEFPRKGDPKVSNISISLRNLEALQKNLLLIFTKIKRKAVEIEKSKLPSMTKQKETLKRIRDMALESVGLFESKGSLDLAALGKLLEEGWQLKKSLSPLVSNAEINEFYERAKRAGATAGKILGAGGGGFLMLLAPPESHPKIIQSFAGHHNLQVELGAHGSEVIFDGRAIKTGTST